MSSGHSAVFEKELQSVLSFVLIPGIEIFSLREIDFHVRDLESYSFIGLSCKEQILVLVIYCLYFLLIRAHYAIARLQLRLNFRVFNFKQKRLLTCLWVFLLYDVKAWSANLLRHSLFGDPDLWLRQIRVVLLLSQLPSVQVCLMFLPGGVSQVRRFVGVQRQAEAALK